MFRRRGCLFGCGSFLILAAGMVLLVWFVVIPRIATALEDGVRDSIATVIADEINPLYSRVDLQNGQDIRVSYDTINQQMRNSGQDSQMEGLELTSVGDSIVMRGSFSNQDVEMALVPEITGEGRLRLDPVEEGGWLEQRILGVLGDGLETAVNEWLGRNGIILTDIALEPDGIIMSVQGE